MDWHDFMAETLTDCGTLAKEIPDTMSGFDIMGKAAKTEGALDLRTKEFMALGIAIATRCEI